MDLMTTCKVQTVSVLSVDAALMLSSNGISQKNSESRWKSFYRWGRGVYSQTLTHLLIKIKMQSVIWGLIPLLPTQGPGTVARLSVRLTLNCPPRQWTLSSPVLMGSLFIRTFWVSVQSCLEDWHTWQHPRANLNNRCVLEQQSNQRRGTLK